MPGAGVCGDEGTLSWVAEAASTLLPAAFAEFVSEGWVWGSRGTLGWGRGSSQAARQKAAWKHNGLKWEKQGTECSQQQCAAAKAELSHCTAPSGTAWVLCQLISDL